MHSIPPSLANFLKKKLFFNYTFREEYNIHVLPTSSELSFTDFEKIIHNGD
jgi:hypothetical protein